MPNYKGSNMTSSPALTQHRLLKPILVAGLISFSCASQAAITVYTTLASFNAATSSQATDTFADLSTIVATPSPITRTVGAYKYTATAPLNFFAGGTPANPFLSTNNSADTITFNTFTGGVSALGGNFFASDVDGNFLAGDITISATDSSGTVTQTIVSATTNSFLGFVSTGNLTTVSLFSPPGPTPARFPSVDNLVLAVTAVSPVPEPQAYISMMVGLGLLGFIRRRRAAKEGGIKTA
jgi:PEP-CTERM motif